MIGLLKKDKFVISMVYEFSISLFGLNISKNCNIAGEVAPVAESVKEDNLIHKLVSLNTLSYQWRLNIIYFYQRSLSDIQRFGKLQKVSMNLGFILDSFE